MDISGIININKPKGITSFGVVKRIKSKLGVKKVGHCGTLDPDATGVLLVCFGSATKKSSFALKMDKCYRGVFRLGIRTDTDDMSGKVLSVADSITCCQDDVREVLGSFEGEIEQKVPVYSAVKLKGRSLYKYARKGIVVDLPIKKVFVGFFRCTGFESPLVYFEAACSSGTYVRSLVRDAGEKLGCGAALAELERTSIGNFGIKQSLDLDWVMKADVDEILDKRVEL